MAQLCLPLFPADVTEITPEIAFAKRDGVVIYFSRHLPIFQHDEKDIASFRIFVSQLIINGQATQKQISKIFCVPAVTIKRAVKILRTEGSRGFFKNQRGKRKGRVLTPENLQKAQRMLDAGKELQSIGEELNIKTNTLNKAVQDGRLYRAEKIETEEKKSS